MQTVEAREGDYGNWKLMTVSAQLFVNFVYI